MSKFSEFNTAGTLTGAEIVPLARTGSNVRATLNEVRDYVVYLDTAANFASENPTLLNGQFGIETDTGVIGIGDGSTAWNSLAKKIKIESSGNVRTYGDLSIGDIAADSKLHVFKGSAGTVTAIVNTVLTIENSTTAYLSFLTPNNVSQGLVFGDADSNAVGSVLYNHALDTFTVGVNGADRLAIDSNGNIFVVATYSNTTALAANLYIDVNGGHYRSTSSKRFKTKIEDMEKPYSEIIYQMRPIYYKSLCKNDNKDWSFWGFLAEDLAELDPRLVFYGYYEEDWEDKITIVQQAKEIPDPEDETKTITVTENIEKKERVLKDGATLKPDGVQYERITVLLVDQMQEQKKIIDQQAAIIAELLQRVEALEGR